MKKVTLQLDMTEIQRLLRDNYEQNVNWMIQNKGKNFQKHTTYQLNYEEVQNQNRTIGSKKIEYAIKNL